MQWTIITTKTMTISSRPMILSLVCCCMILTRQSHAFGPSLLRRPAFISRTGCLNHLTLQQASSSSSNNEPPMRSGEWIIPNDFKLFLTQCSLQSFMFLLRQMRDPETVYWLEKFTQPALTKKRITNATSNFTFSLPTANQTATATNLSGSLKLSRTNGTSTALSSDENTHKPRSSSKLLQYHGLAAMNTTLFPSWEVFFAELLEQPAESFLVESSSPHIPEYELEIDPASLCSRIVSVREQIAREFVRDLQVIADMGGHTLESYWGSLKLLRDDNSTDTSSADGTAGNNNKVQRENLLFLELNADAGSDYAPSPLRKGNFDLLVLLSTQEAIHRVLNDESRRDGPEKATNDFLATFYTERLHHFSGNQRYGRADDFLEELLSLTPRMVTTKEGMTSLIDPTRIAELIVEEREAVALDWKTQAEGSPQEHMTIQKMRLNRMMGVVSIVDEEEESFQ